MFHCFLALERVDKLERMRGVFSLLQARPTNLVDCLYGVRAEEDS